MKTGIDRTGRMPAVLHRWHDLTSSEQEAIARVVDRMASLPLNEGERQRCREWGSTCTVGVEVWWR